MFAPQVSVLPLQRPDEIHIPNPSWMQSPSPRATKFVSVPKFLLSNPQFFELIIEILLYFFFYCSMKIHLSDKMKVAFGGVDPVSQPPCQPDRSNEQTGTSNALALPGPKGSKSTQKGVTENALVIGPTFHPKGGQGR
ncbi:uncharacterized protein BNAC07G33960D isoform X2 [Brassica napus]|uniref:uncharacterized protein BNAC07G33960D isoform X2 n=1 Tax=Brassica napus TaxID=3708 RepID=UPI000BBE73FB|nr:uncharacterized protein BNAC07G33960D isoform X2 [Brassica napus]